MSCNNVFVKGVVFSAVGRIEMSDWVAVKSCGVISCSVATARVNCAPDDVVTSLAAAATIIPVLVASLAGAAVVAGVTAPGAAAEEDSNCTTDDNICSSLLSSSPSDERNCFCDSGVLLA